MAFRSSTTNTGSSATPSTAVPTGVQSGDIVILTCAIDSETATFEAGDWPTGFTELAEAEHVAQPDWHSMAVAWKRLTGADSGSYTLGDVGASTEWLCQAFAFSGRHATDPPVISTTNQSTANNPNPVTVTANGVTAVEGDDLLWISAPDVSNSGVGNGHTPPTNYTEAQDAESTAWVNLSGAYRDNVSAGATGTVSGTFNVTATGSGWTAWLVRIPVAAAGGGATLKPYRMGLLGVH